MKTKPKKECAIFNCEKHHYNKCCYYCDKRGCKNWCKNTPDKCGQHAKEISNDKQTIKKLSSR